MALPPLNDTISAIATAPGTGAIGVIRLSGPNSFAIAAQLFKPKKKQTLRPGKVYYGTIYNNDEIIDEAIVLSFKAPHSYTAQDVIELQTHGGPAVLRRVLELSQSHGARLAKPGEFTLRAFVNGRIDLVQAESVLEMVNAQSETARRNAALGLSKSLSEQLQLIQTDITRVYGNLQAVFDYPEEGVPESEYQTPLNRALKRIDQLLSTAKAGQIAQKGARLALVGKPNAGKSSLLNALLGYQRSIVSNIPGTTRDYLEAPLTLKGIPITAIDTAGIRETEDLIEASGVTAAKDIAAHADLSLYLLDASQEPTEEDFEVIASLEPSRSLLILSKADLPQVWTHRFDRKLHKVSATKGEGLEELKTAISEKLIGDASSSELWLSSERHAQALQQTRGLVEQALSAPDDLAALDLEEALRALAEITGRGDIAEETLEHIFANFCVGK
jgi:tRNA modification GTPase